MDEIIISLGVFIAPVFVVYLIVRYKLRRLQILHDLVKSNTALTPQVVELLRQPPVESAQADFRRGVFYMATGLAVAVILGLGAFANSPRLALVALLPIFLGLAHLITGRLASDRKIDSEPGSQL